MYGYGGFMATTILKKLLFFPVLLAGIFYTACNFPLGMGEPVDTTAPTITIITPRDSEFMRGIAIGQPIYMAGLCSDDFGVTELKARVSNVFTGETFYPRFTYTIEPNDTWRGFLYLPGNGLAEYRVRISALDKYKNEGADEVVVKVDIIAPWVRESSVKRHSKFSSELKNPGFYEALLFQSENMYKGIQFVNIDDFQNEAFTVSLFIDYNMDNVAASRLDVYSEDGEKLNSEPIPPTSELEGKRAPEWRITHNDMIGWDSKYAQGAHYIYFVAMAWNTTAWDPTLNGGKGGTVPGENHREQTIDGTCWYPESDYPHIRITNDISGGFVTLGPNMVNALSLQFYDDDKLSEIYAAIIPKEEIDEVLDILGLTEAQYLELLAVNSTRRSEAIDRWDLENIYDSLGSLDGRNQTVYLGTGDSGEYRLLAMVKDDKSLPLDTLNNEQWTVHPPLRIQVQDLDDPLIIVENPAMENIFPTLTDGRKFSISAYTIDNQGVDMVQIAWVPANSGLGTAEAQAALIATVTSLAAGNSEIRSNGIKIWKPVMGERSVMTLNSINYTRDNFSQEFDIIDDFQFNSLTQNDNKLFVIHARKGTRNVFKNFRLTGNTVRPVIEVLYPNRDMLVHDTRQDLHLRMRVTSGTGINEGSVKILDRTPLNSNDNFGMSPIAVSGNIYETLITKEFIEDNKATGFAEGSRRTYRFEAEDILGNFQAVERTIIMSNLPALVYITSSNAPGSYGVGSTLRFEAVFSLPVRIYTLGGSGPRLKLYFSDPGTTDPLITSASGVYADYVTAAGNTIVFSYTVKEGDKAELLYNSFNPIDLNGSTIETTDAAGGYAICVLYPGSGLQDRVAIELDGIRPKIEGAGFSQPQTWPYYNNGKTVTLELYASKRVRVSGTPIAKIAIAGKPGTVDASFSKVTHEADKSILFFTYMVDDVTNSIPESPLAWAAPWIEFVDTDSITDMAENSLDLRPASLPTGGALDGTNLSPQKPAYIVTAAPPAPSFTLYSGFNGSNPVDVLSGSPILINNSIYITVSGAANNYLYYSLEAGNNQKQLTGSYAEITETSIDDPNKNSGNSDPHNSSYIPSEYKVTAWQIDRAGNRSSNTAERSVIINSRAPELVDITCTEPNGSYNAGKILTFKLVFSRKVEVKGIGARLTLLGTFDGYTGYTDIEEFDLNPVDNPSADTALVFKWQIRSGLKMKNIKATQIILNNVFDEYGNVLKRYTDVSSETNTQRRIVAGSSFNLQRDSESDGTGGLVVDSVGPAIDNYSPTEPGTGALSNGGIMPKAVGAGGLIEDGEIVLTFDKPVWAQSGKTITIRPWGNWAIPPILTIEEMNALYNSPLFGSNTTEYQRRLKWIDANGLPELGLNITTDLGLRNNLATAFGQRTRYNSYINTTNGLVQGQGGLVRPDTTGKWVLAFDRDVFENVQYLREIFNAARWKWQTISATSGSVAISENTVTITLPEPLQKGRIWEVLIDEGAFRDAAGNESAAIGPATAPGAGYRFWTQGTADPVIRADRHSHGDNYHGLPASYRGDWNARPFIDIKVRIDCETPGATIRYDTIRTKYTLKATGTGTNSDAFTVNTVPANTAGTFFDHTNIINGIGGNTTTGYSNNSIGNGGSHSNQQPPPSANGYFIGLLIPNKDDSSGTTDANMVSQNGAVLWANVTERGGTLSSGFSTGRVYRTIAADGTVSWPNTVFNVTAPTAPETAVGLFFYAGDAYTDDPGLESHRNAASNTDEKLFTGRRDYVISAARKNAVTTAGVTAGPALDVSGPGYEGIFKTTVLQREPGAGMYWLTVQGFDTPITPSTPGFPLQEYIATPPDYTTVEHLYFSRQAWRTGAISGITAGTTGTWPTGFATQAAQQNNNNHIWVSWDIVSDWYLKGRNRSSDGGTVAAPTLRHGRLQRAGFNYGAVLATYGAVTYRYRQNFDNSYTGTTQ